MEKLIELLNESEREKVIHRTYYLVSWYIMYKRDDGEEVDDKRTDLEIISKSYWFIKRLVENDKIDRYKFEVEYMDKQTLEDVYIAWAKQDELLIMILAISDTPILFLVSILK